MNITLTEEQKLKLEAIRRNQSLLTADDEKELSIEDMLDSAIEHHYHHHCIEGEHEHLDNITVKGTWLEIRHYCRIDYEETKSSPDYTLTCTKLERDLLDAVDGEAEDVEVYGGYAACAPYVAFWCFNFNDAVRNKDSVMSVLSDNECKLL